MYMYTNSSQVGHFDEPFKVEWGNLQKTISNKDIIYKEMQREKGTIVDQWGNLQKQSQILNSSKIHKETNDTT
jgi:hypothetical protein